MKPWKIVSAAAITLSIGLLEAFQPNGDVPVITPESPADQRCSVQNSSFEDGEEIIYKIYYNWNFIWTTAGFAHFKLNETKDAYHVQVSGSTQGFYDPFYKVRDTFETYLNKETLLPQMFIRDVEEGSYTKYNKFIFDQEGQKVTAWEGKDRASLEKKEFEFNDCMHDMLSIFYHMRNVDFDAYEEGESFGVDVFLEENYPLTVKFLEKDQKTKVKGFGKFNTHVFQPQVIAGEVFDEGAQMTIYVSADENKLPVMIESPLIVGKIKAVLYNYRGLRHDLDAKIK